MDFQEAGRLLKSGLKAVKNGIEYQNVFEARLGQGTIPGVVVVPTASRQHDGEVYIHTDWQGARVIGRAILGASSVPLSNSYAGLPVRVGTPTGSSHLVVFDQVQGAGQRFTGGASPLSLDLMDAAQASPERSPNLLVTETNPPSMSVRLSPGQFRIGNTFVPVAEINPFYNFTSKVPTVSGRARWWLLTITKTKEARVYSGPEFVLATTSNRADYIPTPTVNNEFILAAVMLYQGMPDVRRLRTISTGQRYDIVPMHTMPTAQDPGMGVTVSAGEPLAPADKSWWIDTSGGTGKWVLKSYDATNNRWETVPGSISGSTVAASLDSIIVSELGIVIVSESGRVVVAEG